MHGKQDSAVDWGILAGYEEQKRQIEDSLLLALLHPGQCHCLSAACSGRGPQGRMDLWILAGSCTGKHGWLEG